MNEDLTVGRIVFGPPNTIPVPEKKETKKERLDRIMKELCPPNLMTFNSMMEAMGYKLTDVRKDDNILEDDIYVYGDKCEDDVKRGM